MAELLEVSKEDILAILGLGDPTRGDIITVNSTPDYVKLAIGAADTLLISDGTDIAYSKISNANLNAGIFANITGVGAQAQTLDMGSQIIDNVQRINDDQTHSMTRMKSLEI